MNLKVNCSSGSNHSFIYIYIHICFQFEMRIRNAAQDLVHLPPQALYNPQQQPQAPHPFSLVRLRPVEQKDSESQFQPLPEDLDAPAPPPSCHSAIHFMSRVLQRLREVDQQVSEVMAVSSSFHPFSSLCLSVSSLTVLYVYIHNQACVLVCDKRKSGL